LHIHARGAARARAMEAVKDAQQVSTPNMLTFDAQKVVVAQRVGACPAAPRVFSLALHATADLSSCLPPRPSVPFPFAQLGTDFLGVLLNPPWSSVTPKQVEALALPKLCPLGFVFVWVEKEVLDQVVDVMVRLKYVYVENLTWVLMRPNNRVRTPVRTYHTRAVCCAHRRLTHAACGRPRTRL
jgi:hypothetical protein